MDLSKDSYWQIIDNLNEGVYIANDERRIIYWNQAAERITGWRADEVVGQCCSDNILCHVDAAGTNLCQGRCPLAEAIRDGAPRQTEIFLHHKNGHRVPISVRVTTLTDEGGSIIGAVETFTDLSNRIANEARLKELEKLALVDGLTHLANRHCLEKELEGCLGELQRYGNPFGLLFMDLDNFKKVNDRYGHDLGDQVLTFVAATLAANSRPFDLYGRWGGEEFIGIIRNITATDLEQIGSRLLHLVQESFVTNGQERVKVTLSIGATIVTKSDTIATLVQRADGLMYQSKSAGKNRLTLG